MARRNKKQCINLLDKYIDTKEYYKTILKGAAKEKEIERLEHLHHVLLHVLRDNGLEKAFETYKQSTETMLHLADIESKIPSSILNDLRESNDLNYRTSKAVLETKEIVVIL